MFNEFKFRRVNEITGVFVLAVVVLVIASIVWTARSQRWFRSEVFLRIILPEAGAAGIRQGSEIYFLGTRVGSVSDVLVDKKGSMQAHARIRRDFFLFVRDDSSAVVKRKFGVAGDSFFEITRGVGKTLPEENAWIMCNEQFQSGLELAIEEIRAEAILVLKKANAGIDTWTGLGSSLRQTGQKLDGIASRSEALLAGIENGDGTLGQLFGDNSLADETLELLRNSQALIGQASSALTNINATVAILHEGSARFPEITDALAAEARDLPGLVKQTQASMREMEAVFLAMQKHWLLRRYMSKTNEMILTPHESSTPTKKRIRK